MSDKVSVEPLDCRLGVMESMVYDFPQGGNSDQMDERLMMLCVFYFVAWSLW